MYHLGMLCLTLLLLPLDLVYKHYRVCDTTKVSTVYV